MKRFNHPVLTTISFILLFLSFAFNIFGVGNTNFNTFQKDSESLITNKIGCQNQHGQDIFGGQLVVVKNGLTAKEIERGYQQCSQDVFQAYTAQFGLQGKIVGLLAPRNHIQLKIYLWIFKSILVGLLAAALTYLVLVVTREFSLVSGVTLLIGLILSDWIVFFARNLYWVTVLLFLPFIFSFGFYPKFKRHKRLWIFYLCLGGLFLLKFLNGYEFLSNIILSAFAPILYYEIKSLGRIDWRRLAQPFIRVLLAGAVGFILALALNIAQASLYLHSFDQGVTEVANRAIIRTVGNPDSTLVDVIGNFRGQEIYIYSMINNFYPLHVINKDTPNLYLKALVSTVIGYLFINVVSIPLAIRQPIGVLAQSAFSMMLIWAFISWRWKESSLLRSSPQHLAIFAASVYALLASISWLVIAQGHMINHLHLDGIVYYLPFLPIFYIIVGMEIEASLKRLGLAKSK